MKNTRLYTLAASFLSLMIALNVQAQEYFILQTNNSKLVVEGTSTVHDWEVEATDFSAETLLRLDENAVSHIEHVEFNTPAESLKSGKRLMDNKTHEALKANKFPEIKFTLNGTEAIKLSGEQATVGGLLTIAGKTREVQMTVDMDMKNEQTIGVSGQVPVKMSDFGIDPPTAMMGTIKTGNDVTVKFDLEFRKSSDQFTRK
jgi:polyisoprenoid-binding protein YceI